MSIAIPPLFDACELQKSESERLQYFENKIVAHTHLRGARELAIDCIDTAPSGDIVTIVGPSGVGTTTLGRSLFVHYRALPKSVMDPKVEASKVRTIGFDAPSSAGGVNEIYWKNLLSKLLRSGGDLLVSNKLYVPHQDFQLQYSIPPFQLSTQHTSTLQSAALGMLHQRGTKLVVINQAERLFPVGDRKGCLRSREMLRDLAATSNTRFLLVADYDILKTLCDGQPFLQRKQIVHLRRYDIEIASEWALYTDVMSELLGHIPSTRRLKKLSEKCGRSLYYKTVGCIGTLKEILRIALNRATRNQEDMTEDMLLGLGQSLATAADIGKKAMEAERMLTDVGQSDVERILAGGHRGSTAGESTGRTGSGSMKAPSNRYAGSRNGRIGERNPTRDPVGQLNVHRA